MEKSMIYGIGIDIVKIERMRTVVEKWGQRFLKRVFTKNEISYCYDAGIRRFVFIDDIFNLEKKNSSRLLETIIKSKMDVQLFFPNGLRGDILEKDFIDLMRFDFQFRKWRKTAVHIL